MQAQVVDDFTATTTATMMAIPRWWLAESCMRSWWHNIDEWDLHGTIQLRPNYVPLIYRRRSSSRVHRPSKKTYKYAPSGSTNIFPPDITIHSQRFQHFKVSTRNTNSMYIVIVNLSQLVLNFCHILDCSWWSSLLPPSLSWPLLPPPRTMATSSNKATRTPRNTRATRASSLSSTNTPHTASPVLLLPRTSTVLRRLRRGIAASTVSWIRSTMAMKEPRWHVRPGSVWRTMPPSTTEEVHSLLLEAFFLDSAGSLVFSLYDISKPIPHCHFTNKTKHQSWIWRPSWAWPTQCISQLGWRSKYWI